MDKKNQVQLSEIKEGNELPRLKKTITQQNINLYAQASQDLNPVHIDETFARNTPLGGTIAHGMLILAYISQMMMNAFGQAWLTRGKLNVRFKDPARPGDTVTVSGKITSLEIQDGQSVIHCNVLCNGENGNSVITGEAIVVMDS